MWIVSVAYIIRNEKLFRCAKVSVQSSKMVILVRASKWSRIFERSVIFTYWNIWKRYTELKDSIYWVNFAMNSFSTVLFSLRNKDPVGICSSTASQLPNRWWIFSLYLLLSYRMNAMHWNTQETSGNWVIVFVVTGSSGFHKCTISDCFPK